MAKELVHVVVADSAPTLPFDDVAEALAGFAHSEAVEEFGPGDCSYWVFGEGDGYGNREDFERILRSYPSLPSERVADHLHGWDAASRPCAIIHTQPAPMLN